MGQKRAGVYSCETGPRVGRRLTFGNTSFGSRCEPAVHDRPRENSRLRSDQFRRSVGSDDGSGWCHGGRSETVVNEERCWKGSSGRGKRIREYLYSTGRSVMPWMTLANGSRHVARLQLRKRRLSGFMSGSHLEHIISSLWVII